MKDSARLPIEVSIPMDPIVSEISEAVIQALRPLLTSFQLPQQPGQLLTRKQAAKKLSVSLPTLDSWGKQGAIKAYRIGSRLRYKEDELESALIEMKTSKQRRVA